MKTKVASVEGSVVVLATGIRIELSPSDVGSYDIQPGYDAFVPDSPFAQEAEWNLTIGVPHRHKADIRVEPKGGVLVGRVISGTERPRPKDPTHYFVMRPLWPA